MAKFAIIGSGYTSRLRDFCGGDLKVPGECRFFCEEWMSADSIPHRIIADIKVFGADAVFIHLGENDIRQDSNPIAFFNSLCAIEETLSEMGATVYIAEICRRGDFSKAPGLTEESFNKQRNAINRLLKKKYRKRQVRIPVQYPTHYEESLVYFSETGIRQYFFAVRRVFVL